MWKDLQLESPSPPEPVIQAWWGLSGVHLAVVQMRRCNPERLVPKPQGLRDIPLAVTGTLEKSPSKKQVVLSAKPHMQPAPSKQGRLPPGLRALTGCTPSLKSEQLQDAPWMCVSALQMFCHKVSEKGFFNT